jgi:hypothetical protein
MAVWDVPSPITSGGEVKLRVGVKCHAGCKLEGARIEIRGSEGERVATGRLGGLPLPGTSSLYWTEVRFKAPSADGYREWTARFREVRSKVPHKGASYTFGLMTVAYARHPLEINVADSVTKAPLDNAYVRVGGYTCFSDKTGVAKVSVPNGSHEFVVWKRDHKMFRTTVNASSDSNLKVELVPTPCRYCPDRT